MNCQFLRGIARVFRAAAGRARLPDSATLREPMHRANGNGKLVPAFIAPFAAPSTR